MELKTDTKSKIMHAAIKLFPDLGYEKTSMRLIAQEVGISKPALYYYYKNKDELFRSIVEFGNKFSHQKLVQIRDQVGTIEQKLKELIWIKFSFLQESEEVRRFSSWMTTDGIKYLIKYDINQEIIAQMNIIYEIIDNAKEKGELRSDLDNEAFVFLLFGAANIYIRRSHHFKEENMNEEKVKHLIETLMRSSKNN